MVNPDARCDLYVNAWHAFDYWFAPIMMESASPVPSPAPPPPPLPDPVTSFWYIIAVYRNMAEALTQLMPRHSAYTRGMQALLDSDREVFTDVGFYLEPSRVLGESIGFSSEYAEAIHPDITDIGFTVAWAGATMSVSNPSHLDALVESRPLS